MDFCNKIDGEGFFEQITQLEPRDIDTMKLQNVVSVQATAWLAPVTDRKKNAEAKEGLYAENIFEIFEESKKNHFYEFIGHDIDAGFRLTKQTRERRLTVSFELAYMLSGRDEHNERMQIITYRSLKGVWGGKVYPIIWYYDKSKNENIEFIDSLPIFDKPGRSPKKVEKLLAKEIIANARIANRKYMLFRYSIFTLVFVTVLLPIFLFITA